MNSHHEIDTKGPPPSVEPKQKLRGLYAAMWRWHFYAGLFSIPICIFLGITGAIYLFKPVVEPWLYQDMQQVAVGESMLAAEQQLGAARKAFPNAKAAALTLGDKPTKATEIAMRSDRGQNVLVYVDPYTGTVTGNLVRDEMFMNQVRDLHGEIMMGWFGSALVELTACWTIVLILTGIYLWWPRPWTRVQGVWVPRLLQGGRVFWRDLHTVVGAYASVIVLVLLVTGLPWTNVWGGAFKRARVAVGQNHPEAAGRRVRLKSEASAGKKPMDLAEAMAIADSHHMPKGYSVMLPNGPTGVYGFTSRPLRLGEFKFVYVDQYSGKVISQATWDDHPTTAKAITMGIRLHQGELFGWFNLVLMLIGAIAVVWMSITALFMWWQRRPTGTLGAPPLPRDWRLPGGIAVIMIAMSVLFPLVGGSLLILFVAERYLVPRIPGASAFLGLQVANS